MRYPQAIIFSHVFVDIMEWSLSKGKMIGIVRKDVTKSMRNSKNLAYYPIILFDFNLNIMKRENKG